MTDEVDVFGPIDFVLIEFPGDRLTGRAGAALLDLVDAGIIGIWTEEEFLAQKAKVLA